MGFGCTRVLRIVYRAELRAGNTGACEREKRVQRVQSVLVDGRSGLAGSVPLSGSTMKCKMAVGGLVQALGGCTLQRFQALDREGGIPNGLLFWSDSPGCPAQKGKERPACGCACTLSNTPRTRTRQE